MLYLGFINYYFTSYKIDDALFVQDDFFESLEYINRVDNDNICINGPQQSYIYLLLHNNISPQTFNKELTRVYRDSGHYEILQFGKYNFSCKSIDDNYIYVIDKNDSLYNRLISLNYKYDRIGKYYVMYK